MGTPANKAGFEQGDTANDLGSLKTAFQAAYCCLFTLAAQHTHHVAYLMRQRTKHLGFTPHFPHALAPFGC